jgi:hypothetical protein
MPLSVGFVVGDHEHGFAGQGAVGYLGEPIAFTLALSPHFANEDATTQKLSTPAGKAGGDFQAGKRIESTDDFAHDVGTGKFTEHDTCIKATASATGAYQLLVLRNNGALDAYAQVAEWTIGVSGISIAAIQHHYRQMRA